MTLPGFMILDVFYSFDFRQILFRNLLTKCTYERLFGTTVLKLQGCSCSERRSPFFRPLAKVQLRVSVTPPS